MLSEETLREINQEVRQLITQCCQETANILKRNNIFLHMLAESLLANETLDGEEIDIVYRCYTNQKSIEDEQHQTSKMRRIPQ